MEFMPLAIQDRKELMDYRRLNISQLSREFKTRRALIQEWIRKGYLIPCQIHGNQKKFTIEAFLKAEKTALIEAEKVAVQEYVKAADNFKKNPVKKSRSFKERLIIPTGGRIPAEWFDNLELLCKY